MFLSQQSANDKIRMIFWTLFFILRVVVFHCMSMEYEININLPKTQIFNFLGKSVFSVFTSKVIIFIIVAS